MNILGKTILQKLLVKHLGTSSCQCMPIVNFALQQVMQNTSLTQSIETHRLNISRSISTSVIGQAKAEKSGILRKIASTLGLGSTSKELLNRYGYLLYENVVEKVDYFEFSKKFGLPNTFNTWFLITELHVWMLMVRAMAEGSNAKEDGRRLRNFIVEAMWRDVNNRAKALGNANPRAMREQIQELALQFQGSIVSYDEGLLTDDKTLANAIWQRIFDCESNDFEKIELLIIYIRRNIQHLDSLNKETFFLRTKWGWIGLKEIEKQI